MHANFYCLVVEFTISIFYSDVANNYTVDETSTSAVEPNAFYQLKQVQERIFYTWTQVKSRYFKFSLHFS
jgi:hypothetical protein